MCAYFFVLCVCLFLSFFPLILGDDLKDFFISVAKKLPHRTAGFEDNENYRGKVCLRHPGFLEQGEIYHGLCNNGYGLQGRYVLILKRPERNAIMVICEVHVYALPITGKCMTDLQVKENKSIFWIHK